MTQEWVHFCEQITEGFRSSGTYTASSIGIIWDLLTLEDDGNIDTPQRAQQSNTGRSNASRNMRKSEIHNSFISSNLIHNSYINSTKLNASTCFGHHPPILRRLMSLIIQVCSLWCSRSAKVKYLECVIILLKSM